MNDGISWFVEQSIGKEIKTPKEWREKTIIKNTEIFEPLNREYQKKYSQDNREKLREYQREYRGGIKALKGEKLGNKTSDMKEYKKTWYQENKERLKEKRNKEKADENYGT